MEQFDAIESFARRNRILDIFNDKGPITLDALKEEYEQRAGETFPFGGDELTIRQLFLEYGIQYDYKLNRYYIKRAYNYRKARPIFHGTPYTKRSKSAPFDEDEDDIEEIKRVVINAGSSNSLKNPQRQSRPSTTRSKENGQQKKIGNEKARSKSEYRSQMLGKPNYFGTIVISDDFFIGITSKILGFKTFKEDGILQSGFCVSGLTIPRARKMIEESVSDDRYKSALIYLGSMDIVQNEYLIKIMQEFTQFLTVCVKKKIHPIVCTLAPIPNLSFDDNRVETIKAFNMFLRNNKFNIPVLDVYSCFVNPQTEEFFEHYYCQVSNKTSGSDKPLVLWSVEGSKRVHEFILKNIGFALLTNEAKVFNFL